MEAVYAFAMALGALATSLLGSGLPSDVPTNPQDPGVQQTQPADNGVLPAATQDEDFPAASDDSATSDATPATDDSATSDDSLNDDSAMDNSDSDNSAAPATDDDSTPAVTDDSPAADEAPAAVDLNDPSVVDAIAFNPFGMWTDEGMVDGNSELTIQVPVLSEDSEMQVVTVRGDGSSLLDIYLVDSSGEVIDHADDSNGDAILLIPADSGEQFSLRIVNSDDLDNIVNVSIT